VIVERHAADGRRARAVHTDAADEGRDLHCDRWARISALERGTGRRGRMRRTDDALRRNT